MHTSKVNLGKGSAIRFGLEHATGEVVLVQDADLELDPNEYNSLLQPIIKDKKKIVYGSRFLNHLNRRISLKCRFVNRCATLLTNLLYGSKLTDVNTAYKVFRREILEKISLKADRFDFDTEFTAKVIRIGYQIHEVPITYKPRTTKEGKKISWKDGVQGVYTLIKYRFFE